MPNNGAARKRLARLKILDDVAADTWLRNEHPEYEYGRSRLSAAASPEDDHRGSFYCKIASSEHTSGWQPICSLRDEGARSWVPAGLQV
jgi:hypothetical protein